MTKLKTPVGDHDHVQGPEDALVTLVEYGDYECPHCGRAYPIVKQVQERFGDRLRFVFRNFPLIEAHPHAEEAAESAEFAAASEKFWPMHDLLFENQRRFNRATFLALAEQMGLSPAALEKALQEHSFQHHVRDDFKSGVHSGVNGTPTFYINGQRHDGSFDFDELVSAIETISQEEIP